jgi:hypothetical protein
MEGSFRSLSKTPSFCGLTAAADILLEIQDKIVDKEVTQAPSGAPTERDQTDDDHPL